MFLHNSSVPFMHLLISSIKHRAPSILTLLSIKWSCHSVNFMPIRMQLLRWGPDRQKQLAQKITFIFWSWNFLVFPGRFIKMVAWYSILLTLANISSSPTASTHLDELTRARTLQNKLSIFLTMKRLCGSLTCTYYSGPVIHPLSTSEEAVTATDPMLAWVAQVLSEKQWQVHLPHPVCNYFINGILSDNMQTALHVMICLDETNLSLNDLTIHYHLHDFEVQYQQYLHLLCSIFYSSMVMPSQVVQA